MDFFFKLYGDLPKQGPGSEDSTLKALNAIPEHENFKHILDVGCGTGELNAKEQEAVSFAEVEIEMFKKYSDQYGYAFFIIWKRS